MTAASVRFLRSLSGVGLALGTLFFAASLTPSLIPRAATYQGVLAGVSFAAGYGFGVFWRWLWAYLHLPEPPERMRQGANMLLGLVCVAVAAFFLWQSTGWQNAVRATMGMEPVETGRPVLVCALAVVTFAALFIIGRLFRHLTRRLATTFRRFIPPHVANVLAAVLAIFLFWSAANDVLARAALTVLDNSFREWDALLDPAQPQPTSPLRAGSSHSLLQWNEVGRAGREFLSSGPSAQDIGAFRGVPAIEPIRVYVGLGAAETAEDRARLALQEMLRVGAFDRSIVVIVTPTGTGWIDPSAMDSLEYLHGGDVASVALQYSYLSSPLSLIVEPEYGIEAARAIFSEIYRHWTTLDPATRPRLYLHGLSLGALNSERSAEMYEILADPIDGALWAGPPFASRYWRMVTEGRNPGSAAWLPRFGDGSLVRFMNQDGLAPGLHAEWGPVRVVYLQYASDPVTFFDFRDLFRQPAWMQSPRGPDVTGALSWHPVVTMLQLALDMALATTTPVGYGHVYAPEHYVEAWLQVTGEEGWSPEAIAGLKQHLRSRMDAASRQPPAAGAGYDGRGG